MPARRQKSRARSISAPGTAPEGQKTAPRRRGLAAGRWLLAAETLPTKQKSVLIRVSGEKEILMRRPYRGFNPTARNRPVKRRATSVGARPYCCIPLEPSVPAASRCHTCSCGRGPFARAAPGCRTSSQPERWPRSSGRRKGRVRKMRRRPRLAMRLGRG